MQKRRHLAFRKPSPSPRPTVVIVVIALRRAAADRGDWGPIFMADNMMVTPVSSSLVLTNAAKVAQWRLYLRLFRDPQAPVTPCLPPSTFPCPLGSWIGLGPTSETSPGLFQFLQTAAWHSTALLPRPFMILPLGPGRNCRATQAPPLAPTASRERLILATMPNTGEPGGDSKTGQDHPASEVAGGRIPFFAKFSANPVPTGQNIEAG